MFRDRPKYLPPKNDIPPVKEPSFYQSFNDLFNLGVKNETFVLYGWTWEMQTLQEWEWRYIYMNHDHQDVLTKPRSWKIDVLTQSIMSAKNQKGEYYEFIDRDTKQDLRDILLLMSPTAIDEMFFIYGKLEEEANREFRSIFPEIKDELAKGFFGQSGSSTNEEPQSLPSKKSQTDKSSKSGSGPTFKKI